MHGLSPKVKKDHAWNVCFSHLLRHTPTYGWKFEKEKKIQLLMWIFSCFQYKVNIIIRF